MRCHAPGAEVAESRGQLPLQLQRQREAQQPQRRQRPPIGALPMGRQPSPQPLQALVVELPVAEAEAGVLEVQQHVGGGGIELKRADGGLDRRLGVPQRLAVLPQLEDHRRRLGPLAQQALEAALGHLEARLGHAQHTQAVEPAAVTMRRASPLRPWWWQTLASCGYRLRPQPSAGSAPGRAPPRTAAARRRRGPLRSHSRR
jgi:hypothetical protein